MNDTVCHAFISSFTFYRQKHNKINAALFGVSRPLRPRHTKHRRVIFARFSLKFYRLRTPLASYTVKLQRKACKNDAAVFGVSRPLRPRHTKTPLRHFCTLFFEVLPFTDTASVVNGKTSKKRVQKLRGGFWCVKGLDTQKTVASILHAFL